MKILHLPLKAQWYEMIESGIKAEEYREIKPYWIKRFFVYADGRFYKNGAITETARAYTAPTISQVLKWFREEKKVEIVASFDYEDKTWGYQVGDMTLTEDSILAYRWNFPTYEQAALAGIEYVLDNLILL